MMKWAGRDIYAGRGRERGLCWKGELSILEGGGRGSMPEGAGRGLDAGGGRERGLCWKGEGGVSMLMGEGEGSMLVGGGRARNLRANT